MDGSEYRQVVCISSNELEMTEAEKLDAELDRLYPGAYSKSIVSHNGRRYLLTYFPSEKSRTRNSVNEWGHRWTALPQEE